jgi:hypothetical protein
MSRARQLLVAGLQATIAFAQPHAAAAAQSFPALGAYLIADPHDYDQEESQIAKMNVVVLGMFTGWRGSDGQTPQQVIAAIKAKNPNIKIFIYNIIEQLQYPIPAGATSNLTPIDTTPWWLYTDKTSGSMVPTGSNYEINTTTYSKVNSHGQNYLAWRAALDNSVYVTPNPSVDGIYIDDVSWRPHVNGDWTLSGTIQSQDDPATQLIYRLGYVSYINQLKALMGTGKGVIGNVADWYGADNTITQYEGLMEGGVAEGLIGESWSPESTSWATMMAAYAKVMAATAAPQLMIFEQEDTSATDYQNMRYGLTSCLVGGNAYYYFDIANNSVTLFDEYNSNLGAATTSPPTAAYQHGVWRRDFQNGIALVNPKGNGAQTLTLETAYKHLLGTQDPSVNNGTTVTEVTLNDRDGVILLRTTAAQAIPSAPSLTVH